MEARGFMTKNEENTLLIFSETPDDRNNLLHILSPVFARYLNLVPVSEVQAGLFPYSPRAILVTKRVADRARSIFPDAAIIPLRRKMSGCNLRQLLVLPHTAPVLVAAYLEEDARDIICNLRQFGIDQLELHPYWPGCGLNPADYQSVIYAGFRQFAPAGPRQYIDIGKRDIDASTILTIINLFHLPAECLGEYYAGLLHALSETTSNLYVSLREDMQLLENMEHTLNTIPNAMIYLDQARKIRIFNAAAEGVFRLRRKEVVGKAPEEALRAYPALIQYLQGYQDAEDQVIALGDRRFLLTVNRMQEGPALSLLITLRPVESVQRHEATARQKLYGKGFMARHQLDDIVGDSPAIQRSKHLARQYAASDASVLITGESGTGKEMFAQSIHNASSRWHHPFVGINFAALPETLAESELFGYEEGAFTGTQKGGKPGLFEIAHQGTIFLDEIGDASLSMQARLLRVLEEREIIRVGSSQVIPVDVRVISATNQNLPELIRQGRFRHDLYYRLCILPLRVPALRDHREDIPAIMQATGDLDCLDRNTLHRVSAYIAGLDYHWPGNVRELKSALKYLGVMCRGTDGSAPPNLDEILEEMGGFFLSPRPAGREEEPRRERVRSSGLDGDELLILAAVEEMARSSGKAGRYSLARLPQLQARGLTEARLKTRLQKLAARGYLLIGTTRQGVCLTEKGLRALGERREDR